MARIRTIKPEFCQSESIGRISREARLLFVNLITIVDDAGRTRAPSRMLASLLYPYDDDVPNLIEGWLVELENEGCIRRYDFEGSTYLDLPNWLKHQKIDKPSKSRLPAFEEGSRLVAKPRELSAPDLGPSILDLGPGPRTRTKDLTVASQPASSRRQRLIKSKIATSELDSEYEIWSSQFPNQNGPDAAKKAYRSARRSGRATAAELLQGAMRYSQEKTGTDPTYIKTAKNWLNDGDWKNPPRVRSPGASFHDADRGLEDFVNGGRNG